MEGVSTTSVLVHSEREVSIMKKISGSISKFLFSMAVLAIVVSGIVKKGTTDFMYCLDFLKTGNRMISDAKLFKYFVRYYQENRKKPNSGLIDTIPQNEKLKIQVSTSDKVFTERDLNYVNDRFHNKSSMKNIYSLVEEISRIFIGNSTPKTNISSCGSKALISGYLDFSVIGKGEAVFEPFSRTGSLHIRVREKDPDAEITYNDIDNRFVNYMRKVVNKPFALVSTIIEMHTNHFDSLELSDADSIIRNVNQAECKEKKISLEDSETALIKDLKKLANDFYTKLSLLCGDKNTVYKDENAEITAAASLFWRARLSYSGRIENNWCNYRKVTDAFLDRIPELIHASILLHDLKIHNDDFRVFLDRYADRTGSIHLIDTPYILPDGSPDKTYKDPFTLSDFKLSYRQKGNSPV